MALDVTSLKSAIEQAFREAESVAQQEQDPIETVSTLLANAIDQFVRSASVVVDSVSTNVTVVSVSGVTPGAGVSGPGTGTGSGSGQGHLE